MISLISIYDYYMYVNVYDGLNKYISTLTSYGTGITKHISKHNNY